MLALTKPGIEEYAEAKTEPVSPLLERLAEDTYKNMQYPQMLTDRLEGRFLKMMVQISGAKKILEIGMFTGYSALSMIEGAGPDGELTTLDVDQQCIDFAKRYFDQSEYGSRIKVIKGPALTTLKTLTGPFDFVFIDADKTNYLNYYQAVLPMLKSGGVILVDNVLWSGQVIDDNASDDNTQALKTFNDFVARDERVDRVMLTIRDGVYMLRKR